MEINAKMLEGRMVLAIVRDITERKRVEEKLEHSRSQLVEAQRVARVGS